MHFVLAILFTGTLLAAAPAFPTERQFLQPDGTTFRATVRGDEFLNWVETGEGTILRYSKQRDRFEYAVIRNNDLEPSGQAYMPPTAANASAHTHNIDKQALHRLWKLKRAEALERKKAR